MRRRRPLLPPVLVVSDGERCDMPALQQLVKELSEVSPGLRSGVICCDLVWSVVVLGHQGEAMPAGRQLFIQPSQIAVYYNRADTCTLTPRATPRSAPACRWWQCWAFPSPPRSSCSCCPTRRSAAAACCRSASRQPRSSCSSACAPRCCRRPRRRWCWGRGSCAGCWRILTCVMRARARSRSRCRCVCVYLCVLCGGGSRNVLLHAGGTLGSV